MSNIEKNIFISALFEISPADPKKQEETLLEKLSKYVFCMSLPVNQLMEAGPRAGLV
jgi:hypothetical protein